MLDKMLVKKLGQSLAKVLDPMMEMMLGLLKAW